MADVDKGEVTQGFTC